MSYVETSTLKNATIMLLHAERDEINLNPEYQRMGGVWTVNKRRLLIDSILNDYDIPKLYFHLLSMDQQRDTGIRYAVIDGRQRLETIWDFIDGKFTLSDEFEYQKDSTIDLSGFTYQEIAQKYPKIRIKFDSFVLPVVTVEIEGDDLDLIEDMFSRLNEAVPLNAAEKRNAIGGKLIQAINEVSEHAFFKDSVKFSNSRYRHREVSARFFLIEDTLLEQKNLIDTKKEYLDSLARKYKADVSGTVDTIKNSVIDVLDVMSRTFVDKDELLMAQGIQTVYYLAFRTAIINQQLSMITRNKLAEFRRTLSSNRDMAAHNYDSASFEYLEFDRLNQQGTNDANSIKERYKILCRYVGLDIDQNIIN